MSFHEILHTAWHGLHDSLKLLPFLFITYLLMEILEHKAGDGAKKAISRAGRLGPLLGALLGLVPQCGFSAVAAGFYAARVVTPGTVISVFLATSDEMLPVLLGAGIPLPRVLLILAIKLFVAALCGFATDLLFCRSAESVHVHEFCDDEHCHCERGVLRSALHHTLHIFAFVLAFNLLLSFALEIIGEATLGNAIRGIPVLGEAMAALVGLIPNCAASVAIATLYAKGVISAGAMLSGLLAGAGAGLLVLFRTNRNLRENLFFVIGLFAIGTFFGCLLQYTGFLALLGL